MRNLTDFIRPNKKNSKYGISTNTLSSDIVDNNNGLVKELAKRPLESGQLLQNVGLGGELVEPATTGQETAVYDPQFAMASLLTDNREPGRDQQQYSGYAEVAPQGRLSVPALGAYLSALMAQERLRSRALREAAWSIAAESDGLAYLGQLGGERQFASMLNHANQSKSNDGGNLHVIYLVALLVGLLGALLAVKFVMRAGAANQIIRRRFGRSSSQSGQTIVSSENGKQVDLKAANMGAERDMIVNDLDNVHADKAYNLDQLTQRLANLLSHRPFSKMRESPPPDYEEAANDKKELDEASTIDDSTHVLAANQSSGIRSSGSYIRSLIDVLTKARAQMSKTPEVVFADELSSFANEESATTTILGGDYDIACGDEASKQQQEAGIVMSQMDISAAHLILAYMEKHLEDKERLKREWLELNAGPTRGTSAKIVQLMLQRLARVALSDENRHKNRNPLVAPFDRNRVKLKFCSLNRGAVASGAPNGKLSSSARVARNKEPASKGIDYINASYIYDDDPRKPTHIITQGPTEQTCSQFWQMVWEQGISVIVMLTRLNENSTRMCHCYWPTNSGQEPASSNGNGANSGGPPTTTTAGQTTSKDDTNGISSGQASGKPLLADSSVNNGNDATSGASAVVTPPSSNGRRVSVTSVFNTIGARLNPNGQPIVANGDLSNNILCFDVTTTVGQDPLIEAGSENVTAAVDAGGSKSQTGNLAADGNHKQQQQQPNTTSIRFEVHLVSEHVSSSDYLVRNIYMINRSTGETRTITQFHYLSWPENGVPNNVKSFLQFRRKVHKSYRNLKSPILVHCSDGGGRSGTYTLIDIILERIKNGAKEIDPRATLEHLRDQRVGLCATQSQFEFVLVALAEEIQIILNALPQ